MPTALGSVSSPCSGTRSLQGGQSRTPRKVWVSALVVLFVVLVSVVVVVLQSQLDMGEHSVSECPSTL